MIKQVIYKIIREGYLLLHPHLWGHHIQINGIPSIGNIKRLKIGDYISLNSNCYIQCVGGVVIGNYVTVSYGAILLTSGLNTRNYPNTCMCQNRLHTTAPITIGDGVWLGANSMVMPGVTIASKIIVAAGSVVTKSLDKEGWLYGGIPAKPIKPLQTSTSAF